MGSSGWDYFVPYQEDITAALLQLRRDVFKSGKYWSLGTKADRIAELKDQLTDETFLGSDPYLREYNRNYIKAQLDRFESLSEPANVDEEIDQLIKMNGEEGTSSIIDIEKVTEAPEFAAAAPLTSAELTAIFGTEQPDHDMALGKVNLIIEARERWQAAYVIVYKDGKPDEIFFTGYSGD